MKRLENVSPLVRLLLFIVPIFFLVVYLAGAFYFQGHYLPSTYLGPVEISQKSSQEAKATFHEDLKAQALGLSEGEQDLGYIVLDQLGIQADASQELDRLIKSQSAWAWPLSLVKKNQYPLDPEAFSLQSESIEGLLEALAIDNSQRTESQSAFVIKQEDGSYGVKAAVFGNDISPDSLASSLKKAVSQGQRRFSLEKAYTQPRLVEGTEAMDDELKRVQSMHQTEIVLTLPNQELRIPGEEIEGWIQIHTDRPPDVDIEAVQEYLSEVNQTYSPRFQPWLFESTYQGQVWVPAGTLGWYLDIEAEAENLAQLVLEGQSGPHEPVMGSYVTEIGPDYVEVDISHQMMSIYRAGELVLQTPIVSGHPGADTVLGAYQVWNKETNTNLTGYDHINQRDYSTPVSYWIAFDYQGQGIHDASWQSQFGGSVYRYSGSLGCINTPTNVMPEVYELVDYGMPVIVF